LQNKNVTRVTLDFGHFLIKMLIRTWQCCFWLCHSGWRFRMCISGGKNDCM